MSENEPHGQRKRPHPQERFATPKIQINLNSTAAELRSEPNSGEAGHRQKTLFRQEGVTFALFTFDRLTGLAEHQTAGVVSIQVLRGFMEITAAGEPHELKAGQLLILAPGVRHALVAREESEVLVSVSLTAATSVAQSEPAPAGGEAHPAD